MRALGCGPSAIWGGATLGLLIGLIGGAITGDMGVWIRNAVIVGAVIGIIAEVLGAIGDRLQRRR